MWHTLPKAEILVQRGRLQNPKDDLPLRQNLGCRVRAGGAPGQNVPARAVFLLLRLRNLWRLRLCVNLLADPTLVLSSLLPANAGTPVPRRQRFARAILFPSGKWASGV